MGWWPYPENDPPTEVEFSGVQKYLLWIQQHNIEYEQDKRIGHLKEITVTMVVQT